MKTIAFFGHRIIYKAEEVYLRLLNIIEEKISQGHLNFLIGRYGDFDNIALKSLMECRKKINKNIQITIVLTNYSVLKKDEFGNCGIDYYKNNGIDTMMYDIEEVYFKNKINVSNRKMVDDSDVVICYVDNKRYNSGSKKAINYAQRQGKEVINLFMQEDRLFKLKD